MLEGVVTDGTGKQAAIADYTIAGKTGTAKKLLNGSYRGHSNYNVSFVGFAPSRKPKFAIIVVVDSPRGVPAYGGTVAAPIFHRIAQAALQHYGVQRTINAPPPLIVERRAPYSGAPNAPTPASGPAEPPTVLPAGASASGGEPVVPDLTGMSGRDAVRLLATLGLSVQVSRARARHRPAAAAGNAGAGGGLGARMAGPACAGGWAESARSMTVRDLLRSIAALVPGRGARRARCPGARRAVYGGRLRLAHRDPGRGVRGAAGAARRRRRVRAAGGARGRGRGGGGGGRASGRREPPGCRCPIRGSRWPSWPPSSTAIPAARCGWSASPAPTARRPPAIWCAPSSRPPASSAGSWARWRTTSAIA